MRPHRSGWSAFLCVLLGFVAIGSPAQAQDGDKPTLSGSWNASGLSESWNIGDWGDACGPRPRSQGASGGSVQITQVGGELSIVGAGRAFSSAECWEQMPGLSRTSHSSSGGGRFWRTRCSTPANDPRQATIVTSLSATDDSITMVEQGQYQFAIKGQNCTASVSRSRSFSLVSRAGEASAKPSAAPAVPAETAAPKPPPPQRNCDETGAPARLEVKPARKLMRAGETFSFTALVVDSGGCVLGLSPTFRIKDGAYAKNATVTSAGVLTIDAAAPEGQLELIAAMEGKGVSVFVEVASAENYDALLATRGFDAKGEVDESAVALIATGTIGGKGGVAQDAAGERKTLFIAIVGGLAAALALAGFVLLRRGRRAGEVQGPSEDAEPPPVPNVNLFDIPADGRPMLCPVCSQDYPAGTAFCAQDGSPLSPDPDAPPMVAVVAPAVVAPEPSVPPAPASVRPVTEKICPTCGKRYPSADEFCGQDGTTLMPVN